MNYFKARFGSSKSHAWENLFSAPVVGRALWLAGHCRQPQLGCAAHPRAHFFQFCICAIVELNVTFFPTRGKNWWASSGAARGKRLRNAGASHGTYQVMLERYTGK